MIEVLKQMVEALEWCHGGEPIGTAEAIKVGKKAIAELESQKPMAWKHFTRPLERRLEHLQTKEHQNSFDKHEIHALKHVLWVVKQPQRTWVGLTDDEIDGITCVKWEERKQIRSIESKLKEKNT